MSKKISIVSRIKKLFSNKTGTSISQYQEEVKVGEQIERKEYKEFEHYCFKTVNITNETNLDEALEVPEGYEIIKICDRLGYEIESIKDYTGDIFIEFSNNEPVIARVDKEVLPYGFIASRYPGKPIEKSHQKR